jgi:hypothetical protein
MQTEKEPMLSVSSSKKNTMLKMLFFFIILLLIFLTIWLSFTQFRTPKALPANADATQFSAMRAMDYLKEIAEAPHPLGSKEHERVKDFIFSTLSDFGLSPEIQSEEGVFKAWGGDYKGKIENIVAKIPGNDPSGAIMISTHYDSDEESPGAADAGASIASILETARILTKSLVLKNDVIILITDGEEKGLLGAQSFMKNHPWADEVSLVLNFEARGSEGPSILFETNEVNGTLITEFIKGTPNPVAYSFLYDLYKFMPHQTDLLIFKQSGMYGLNFAFFDGFYSYHSANDTISNLNLGSLQHQGENMLHLVRHFGNIDLVDPNPGKKIFFNILGKYVISYPVKNVIPLLIIVIISFVISFLYGMRSKRLTLKEISISFLLFLFMVVIAYLLGHGLWDLISNIFSDSKTVIERNTRISNPLFVGLIFIGYALFTFVYQFASKKINIFNLSMGAYLCWIILAISASIFLKDSSYIFVWPLLFGLAGLCVLMLFKKENLFWSFAVTSVFAVPAILIAVPALYLVYILLTLDISGILLALSILIGAFFIPVLSKFRFRFIFNLPSVLCIIGVFFILGTYFTFGR